MARTRNPKEAVYSSLPFAPKNYKDAADIIRANRKKKSGGLTKVLQSLETSLKEKK